MLIKRVLLTVGLSIGVGLIASSSQAAATQSSGAVVLPYSAGEFAGDMGKTYPESRSDAPRHVQAPKGAPNVLLVMTDDVGFAAASTFGGPVPTPNLDRLAENGLKYNRFHTTAMCSPTRASLLTGRNHHAVGSGVVQDLATGFPGYSGHMPRSAATIAQVLTLNGYNTAMIGKHHNVEPGALSAAGPFDQWPTGLGFEYFYGFVGAETNQFTPALYRGISPVEAPKDVILDKALVDDAVNWLHNQQAAAPDKPFFLYYAPGTAHAPHQAPAEWIKEFRGQFDHGWDTIREEIFQRQKALGVVPQDTVLTPRPESIPPWEELSPARKQTTARMMEVYAAMLAYQDTQFGRLIDELERMGKLDNTVVIFIEGDNGASAEGKVYGHTNPMGGFANNVVETEEELLAGIDELGGPNSTQNWSAGWAWMTNTPFKWTKQTASHLGGTRNGVVMSWKAGIRARGVRSQFHHVVDIAPTILEAAGLPQPDEVYGAKQQNIDGVSMVYSFADPKAPDQRSTQYFEMLANRSIYHDGWLANTRPTRATWLTEPLYKSDSPTDYEWELYDLNKDFSQSQDLAERKPEKLAELKAVFDEEAQRNKVFPLDDRLTLARFREAAAAGLPQRKEYVYWGKNIIVPENAAPRFIGSFRLDAEIDTTENTADGVLAALGSHFAGWSFYLKEGRPVVVMAGSKQPQRTFRIASEQKVPAGFATVSFDFSSEGAGKGGLMRISINDILVAEGRIEQTIRRTVEMTDTFDIGFDSSTAVTDDYREQGRFMGEIRKLTVTATDKKLASSD